MADQGNDIFVSVDEAERLRNEVQFWRDNVGAMLKTNFALYKHHQEKGELDRAGILEATVLLPLRNLARDALAGEYFERCMACGEFIRLDEKIVGGGEEDGGHFHPACISTEYGPAFEQETYDLAAIRDEIEKHWAAEDARF